MPSPTSGNDNLTGNDPGNDIIDALAGNDTVTGLGGDDSLAGGAGDDSLDGGDGHDTLAGGTDDDTLTGGAGNDRYLFSFSFGHIFQLNIDTITDFTPGDDKILLDGALFSGFSSGSVLGSTRFRSGEPPVADGDDFILYDSATGELFFDLDGNGFLPKFHFATLQGAPALIFSDIEFNRTILDFTSGPDTFSGGSGGEVLNGLAGNDTLGGGDGDDIIDGGTDNDNLDGGNGNDTLIGGSGDDLLVGGADSDFASYLSATAGVTANLALGSATGGAGNDSLSGIENLVGSGYGDFLTGDSSANEIYGNGGDDILEGGSGNDTLDGGSGSDTASYLFAGEGVNVSLTNASEPQPTYGGDHLLVDIENLTGSAFDDTLYGDAGANVLTGDAGNDLLKGYDDNDTLLGGAGNDTLYGGAGDDTLNGGTDSDTATYYYAIEGITVSLANTALQDTGSAGWDLLIDIENLVGSSSHDQLSGDGNANIIDGYGGGDELLGLGGNDSLIGGVGVDTIDGGTGADTMAGGDDDDDYYVDDVDDVVIETSTGGSSDRIFSTATSYTLPVDVENGQILSTGAADMTGNYNDNVIHAGVGNNIIDGDSGYDTVSYANGVDGSTGVFIDLNLAEQAPGSSGTDTLLNIENLEGSAFDDTLIGNDWMNELDGSSGNDSLFGSYDHDVLYGNSGADTLDGGEGSDTLTGGDGADTFVFGSDIYQYDLDTITDFDLDEDSIELVALGNFLALPAVGELNPDNFRLASEAADGNDFIVYDQATGELWYDESGEGSSYQSLAMLTGMPELTAAHITVTAPDLYLEGTSEWDTLEGGLGNDTLLGADGEDYIFGFGGDDVVDGAEGNDLLSGGAGNDTIDGGDGEDQLVFFQHYGPLTVDLNVATGQNTGDGLDTITYVEHLYGGKGSDHFTGNGQNNQLYGGYGDDTLIGGDGDDSLNGGEDQDMLFGGDGNDSLYGGNSYEDTLNGGDGNDTLSGGYDGNTYVFDVAPHADTNNDLIEYFQGGLDKIELSLDVFTAFTAIGPMNGANFSSSAFGENPIVPDDGDNYIIFDTVDNQLYYDADGSGEVHSPIHFATLYAPEGGTLSAADFIISSLAGVLVNGSDEVDDYLNGTAGDDTLNGLGGNDLLSGNDGNDILNGGAGNDYLFGGIGADTMSGGTGSDNYVVDDAGDQVLETDSNPLVGGYDNVEVELSTYTLPANVESAFIGHSGAASLYGNELDNHLGSGSGANLIDGGEGNDTLFFSGEGISGVTASLVSNLVTGGAGNDTLESIENITGTNFADVLTGNDDHNWLDGSDGNDTLTGGAGNDTLHGGLDIDQMTGGTGDDNYHVDNVGDVVIENPGEGNDYVNVDLPGTTYTLGINIEGGSIFNSTDGSGLVGNGLDNYLGAGAGANFIDGGAGTDTVSYYNAVTGGVGVIVNLVNGVVTGGSGDDTLVSIERVYGSAYDDQLTGNTLNNDLDGGAGNDTLNGGDGSDFLIESSGDDVIDGGADIDTLAYFGANAGVNVSLAINEEQQNTGGAGLDTISNIERLYGSNYNDTLAGDNSLTTGNFIGGGLGNDLLYGNDGNDTLYGEQGNDTLEGGSGADVFGFSQLHNGGTNGVDTIADFGWGDDRIQLDNRLFTALSGVGTLSAARLRSGAGVTTAADADDFLIYDTSTGNLYYDADGAGGAQEVHILTLGAVEGIIPALSAADIDVQGQAGEVSVGGGTNDTLTGGAGHDSLNGGGGNDVLIGLDGNDTLDGGTGADTMTGGDGSDHYYVDDAGDSVVETNSDNSTGGFGDRVHSWLPSYTLGANIEEGQILSTGIASITGNDLNNLLYAGTATNTINGGAGSDTVSYLFGVTSSGVVANLATGTVTGDSGNDTLLNIENLYGSNFADHLIGNASNNTLKGNLGNDTLEGGDGNDFLQDSGGNDSFQGGNDVFDGGSGVDVVSYYSSESAITASLATGTASGAGSDTFISIEHLYGGKEGDHLTGDEFDNNLQGNEGNDTLIGGNGFDVLDGGNGSDTLTGGGDADRFNFFAPLDGDFDTILDFEHQSDKLVLSSSIFTSLRRSGQQGLEEQNLVYVNDANVEFEPANPANADEYLIYNLANGKLYYDADGSGVEYEPVHFASLWAVESVPALTVQDIDIAYFFTFKQADPAGGILNGTSGDDFLFGQGGNDQLYGGLGADILQGGLGSDIIDGGGPTVGDTEGDTASYQDTPADKVVSVQLGWGRANDGRGGTDTLLKIENLQGGPSNDILAGNEVANVIRGGFGNDILYGFGGDDTLLGDGGDDWIRGGDGVDFLYGGDGDDTADYSQGGSVEVDLEEGLASLGGGNIDLLFDIEFVMGSSAADELLGNEYENLLEGGKGNDWLEGRDGDDVLVGGAGNDTLMGGEDSDLLMGGRDADVFVIDSYYNGGEGDYVLDFDASEGDLLELDDEVFFDLPETLEAGNFVSGINAVAADADDFLIYDTTEGDGMLYYDPDGSGAGSRILIVTFVGAPSLTIDDIVTSWVNNVA